MMMLAAVCLLGLPCKAQLQNAEIEAAVELLSSSIFVDPNTNTYSNDDAVTKLKCDFRIETEKEHSFETYHLEMSLTNTGNSTGEPQWKRIKEYFLTAPIYEHDNMLEVPWAYYFEKSGLQIIHNKSICDLAASIRDYNRSRLNRNKPPLSLQLEASNANTKKLFQPFQARYDKKIQELLKTLPNSYDDSFYVVKSSQEDPPVCWQIEGFELSVSVSVKRQNEVDTDDSQQVWNKFVTITPTSLGVGVPLPEDHYRPINVGNTNFGLTQLTLTSLEIVLDELAILYGSYQILRAEYELKKGEIPQGLVVFDGGLSRLSKPGYVPRQDAIEKIKHGIRFLHRVLERDIYTKPRFSLDKDNNIEMTFMMTDTNHDARFTEKFLTDLFANVQKQIVTLCYDDTDGIWFKVGHKKVGEHWPSYTFSESTLSDGKTLEKMNVLAKILRIAKALQDRP